MSTAALLDFTDVDANTPPAMIALPQWVAWRRDYNAQRGETTKVPYNPATGTRAQSNNPETWGTFEQAKAAALRLSNAEGVGFVFAADDSFVGIDLDDSYTDGVLEPWAEPIVEAINSYTEISPSGTGVKIFLQADKPSKGRVKKYHSGQIETYGSGRWFAVTGQRIDDYSHDAEPRHTEYAELWRDLLGDEPAKATSASLPTTMEPNALAGLVQKMLGHAPAAGENDGSKRLFGWACRGVEAGAGDEMIVAAVRSAAGVYPFKATWTDADIIKRIRDAEHTTKRGLKASPAGRRAVVRPFSEIDARQVEWFWQDHFARGRITVLAAIGGQGKGTMMADISARASNGEDMPDGSPCPACDVLIVSGEDNVHDVLRPRLDAHGANVARVHSLDCVEQITDDGKKTQIAFTLEDVHALEGELIRNPAIGLVVVDPIGSFIGARTDANTDNAVRAVLSPIGALAEKYNVAVVLVAHHRKTAGQSADELILGSRAFTALARSVWHIFADVSDPDRRLLLPGKNNLARRQMGMAFKIDGNPARVVWEERLIDQTADQHLAIMGRPGPEPEAQNEAAEWLQDMLADGPVATNEIKKQAKAAGLSWPTVNRAKAGAKIIAQRNGFDKACWEWRLKK